MRKPRALIFDDDVIIRDFLTRLLVKRGYECQSFGDPSLFCGLDGCSGRSCAGGRCCCDILITDIDMPVVNGLDFLELQQRRGCHLDIRNIAVMSGRLLNHNGERLQRLGCSFFMKPFNLTWLVEWLAQCENRTGSLPLISTPSSPPLSRCSGA